MQTTDVRGAAQGAVDQSKSFLGKQVDDRSTQFGQQIGSVAEELRQVGEQLEQNGVVGPVAGYVHQGADLVENFGKYLQDADSERLIGDLEMIARRRPWAVAAAAAVIGFAASRFLKTTSARRYRASGTTYGGSGVRPYGTGMAYGSGSGYGTGSTYGSQYGAASEEGARRGTTGGTSTGGTSGGTSTGGTGGGTYTGGTGGSPYGETSYAT